MLWRRGKTYAAKCYQCSTPLRINAEEVDDRKYACPVCNAFGMPLPGTIVLRNEDRVAALRKVDVRNVQRDRKESDRHHRLVDREERLKKNEERLKKNEAMALIAKAEQITDDEKTMTTMHVEDGVYLEGCVGGVSILGCVIALVYLSAGHIITFGGLVVGSLLLTMWSASLASLRSRARIKYRACRAICNACWTVDTYSVPRGTSLGMLNIEVAKQHRCRTCGGTLSGATTISKTGRSGGWWFIAWW